MNELIPEDVLYADIDQAMEYFKGDKGDKGEKGEKGDQGIQGIQGEKGDQGIQGMQGDKGDDGYTPIRGTDYWTEADQAAISADLDSKIADKADKADLSDYVKNTDYSSADIAGVVKTNLGYGLSTNANGIIYLNNSTDSEITNRNTKYKIISPQNLNFAVKAVLSDDNRIDDMTDDEKANARSVIGAISQTELDLLKQKSIPSKDVTGYPITLTDQLAGEKPIKLNIYGGKNLIPYPYAEMPAEGENTIERKGITFTYNEDGTITVNGTATENTNVYIKRYGRFLAEKGFLSGCPAGGAAAVYKIAIGIYKNGTMIKQFNDTGNGCAVDISGLDYDQSYMTVGIYKDQNCQNLIFKPQFEEGITATTYEVNKGMGDLSKNLIPYPYIDNGIKNGTLNRLGIHFVDNGDGTITATGTATTACAVELCEFYPVNGDIDMTKKYTVTAGENIPAQMFLSAVLYDESDTYVSELNTGGASRVLDLPTLSKGKTIKKIKVRILIAKDAGDETPVIFKPQIEEGEMATVFNVNNGKYKIPIKCCSKNLIPYPYVNSTMTKNGITFTDNGDGSITANGTATAAISISLQRFALKQKEKYVLSGCPTGGSTTQSYYLTVALLKNGGVVLRTYDIGNSATINASTVDADTIAISLGIVAGTSLNNLTFKPQLEYGTATEYETYVEPSKAVISLDTPLEAGAYIDLAAKKRYTAIGEASDITISGEIQTTDSGKNTIEVETTLKPYKLEVKYYQDVNKVLDNLQSAILSQGGNV